ncbi:Protein kinase domain-containing protein [Psidium guajava]|nr:Protein kinase domain-containing protein [Psidium guajava]
MEEFEYEELVKATESFSSSRLIGKGSHGCVYKGVLTDDRVIAVKTPSLALRALRDNSKLHNETRVLSSLAEPHNNYSSSSSSSSYHDHVIKLLGTSQDPSKNKLLVMEFMPNGSLHDLLHPPPANDAPPPPWPARLRIALQVARALQSLHDRKPFIVHRDIKSANVLFDSDWNAKLADFGLAVTDGDDRLDTPAGTIGYLDPNYTCPSKLSRKNDVFSLGVVLLEIMSGRKAMDNPIAQRSTPHAHGPPRGPLRSSQRRLSTIDLRSRHGDGKGSSPSPSSGSDLAEPVEEPSSVEAVAAKTCQKMGQERFGEREIREDKLSGEGSVV